MDPVFGLHKLAESMLESGEMQPIPLDEADQFLDEFLGPFVQPGGTVNVTFSDGRRGVMKPVVEDGRLAFEPICQEPEEVYRARIAHQPEMYAANSQPRN